ncbi:MAG: hypothetical protein Q8R11_02675 [bacterium]|nr:hypothetical protein [bacterium]
MNIVIGPLEAFYIAGAIALLAVAIIVYPTLRQNLKQSSRR